MPIVKNVPIYDWQQPTPFLNVGFPLWRWQKPNLFIVIWLWTIWKCLNFGPLPLLSNLVRVGGWSVRILISDFLRLVSKGRFSFLKFRRNCPELFPIFMSIAPEPFWVLPIFRRWPSKRHRSFFWSILHLWFDCAPPDFPWRLLGLRFGERVNFWVRSWRGRVVCIVFRCCGEGTPSMCF